MIIRIIVSTAILIGLAATASTIIASNATVWWVFALFSHFRVQYFTATLVGSVFALMQRRWLTSLVLIGAVIANGAVLWPEFATKPDILPSENAPHYRLVLLNLNVHNRNWEAMRRFIHDANADIVVLLEYGPNAAHALNMHQHGYPAAIEHPALDYSGIGVFSRQTLTNVRWIHTESQPVPAVQVTAQLGNTDTVEIIAGHAMVPLTGNYYKLAEHQLQAIATKAKKTLTRTIVAADMNATPWSPAYANFRTNSGLRNSRQGFGLQASWPTAFFPLRIPIDHVWVSQGIAITNHHLGSDVGSDHYPVLVDFVLVSEDG